MEVALGIVLRGLREARGLGQREAGRRAGLPQATIQAWEAGRHRPSGEPLDRLLAALRVEPRERAAVLAAAAPQHAQAALADEPLGPPIGRGAILRAMRGRRSLTQGALARAMGVTQSAVAKWESGDSVPSEETLARLARLLGATPEEAVCLRSADEDDARLSVEEANERTLAIVHSPDWNAREPLFLAHEADLWHRAARDPAWEPALVLAMGYRAAWMHDFAARTAEGVALAHRTMRLAARGGAWDEAAFAFVNLVLNAPRGTPRDERARWLERSERIVARMRDPRAKAFVEATHSNLVASEERGRGGMATTMRRVEDRLVEPARAGAISHREPRYHALGHLNACFELGLFDEASEIEAAIPREPLPEYVEYELAINHSHRMHYYLRHGVEPNVDELRRFEASQPLLDAVPSYRHTVRDWHRAHDARKRRSYV